MTSQLSLEQIRKELQTALRQWANRSAAHRVFTTLTLFQHALRQANGRSGEATDRLLVDLLQALASENERYAFALQQLGLIMLDRDSMPSLFAPVFAEFIRRQHAHAETGIRIRDYRE